MILKKRSGYGAPLCFTNFTLFQHMIIYSSKALLWDVAYPFSRPNQCIMLWSTAWCFCKSLVTEPLVHYQIVPLWLLFRSHLKESRCCSPTLSSPVQLEWTMTPFVRESTNVSLLLSRFFVATSMLSSTILSHSMTCLSLRCQSSDTIFNLPPNDSLSTIFHDVVGIAQPLLSSVAVFL